MAAASEAGEWWRSQLGSVDAVPNILLLSAALIRCGIYDLRAQLSTSSGAAMFVYAAPCRGPGLDSVVLILRSLPIVS